VGLLLTERFVTDGKPLIATGAHRGSETEIRQIIRVLTLYTRARSLTETVDHIHQYTRCLEGLTVPRIQGTRRVFAERSTLFAGASAPMAFRTIPPPAGQAQSLGEAAA
jgi:hypothetical protein